MPTTIDGNLSATGSLYLVNPAGVMVGTGGLVRTGGSFLAATHDLSDADFLDGGAMVLAGSSKASVSNDGTIVALGGDVVLTARRVVNSGTLLAPQGDVGLLAGYEVLLRDTGYADGKFFVQLGGADTEVFNTGTIEAANVELRANGGNVYALAGNANGIIKATGVSQHGGRIFLTAEGGQVTATQRLVAKPPRLAPIPAPRPIDRDGGIIRISGDQVRLGGAIDVSGDTAPGGTIIAMARTQLELTDGARLDASGSDAGLILLGGDFQGGNSAATRYWDAPIATTAQTLVAAGATIIANGSTGAGGSVVVWADQDTSFAGAISATGMTTGGDAEVSGKADLKLSGTADLRAASGHFGTLLLDPTNFVLGPSGTMTGATLNDFLARADVVVSASGDAIINEAFTWSFDSRLSLHLDGSILINADITATGANAGLVLRYGVGHDYVLNGAAITLAGAAASLMIGNINNLQTYTIIQTLSGPNSLQDMQADLAGHYALGTNIDASATASWNGGAGFAPIGDSATSFTGTLAGLGHVVSDLTIDRQLNVGLIGAMDSGTVRDIGLEGGSISGSRNVGGLVGQADNSAISQSYTTGSVSGLTDVGGLVGIQYAGRIERSYASGEVTGIGIS
ncbi:MAG TPA: GLUG motif-containing protein, partial [Devosia sp.]|nr:GLUG motif-containing protein [Devosia sp.]